MMQRPAQPRLRTAPAAIFSAATALTLALSAALPGCTASVAQLQTARVLDKGHFEVTAGASLVIPTQLVSAIADTAKLASKRIDEAEAAGRALSEEEHKQAFETALTLVLFYPSVTPELAVRYGVIDDLDVGLRYASTLVDVDARYQLLRGESAGLDVALTAGYGHHLETGPSMLTTVFDLLEKVDIAGYSRKDIDFGVVVGSQVASWLHLYGAGRYMISLTNVEGRLQEAEAAAGFDAKTDLDGTIHQFGGTAGLRAGYKYIWFGLELTVLRSLFRPMIFGAERNLDGWTVAPTFSLTGTW